ncbi:hypothetical protein AUR64_01575 [Haloprofundus marisrubri]|uniref:Capsular biosynthesis protein n=1 Tax=Haloprofundus marisrubri TaxID=1514971 RepID=A0A0W1R506_9EURY|nr:hypothetical protein [Haloprofundus marisrubri]KTG07952.1 hypothetical protein AUR64_01575 [Haloprofundus marisrubri]
MNDSDGDGESVMPEGEEPFEADHERIAVDFDKTLTKGGESYITSEAEEPDEEMVEWVNYQYRQGHTIIIWTARPWEAAQETVARLTEWGVDWHGIRMEKGHADLYVDDHATPPKEELVDEGFDGDGEVDDGEGLVDKSKDGDADEAGGGNANAE